jgi:hypothetical protein
MQPPRISLRCMMLAAVLALQLLCAAQDPGGTVGDWGSGEIANYKKMAIKTELNARAGVKAKVKSGVTDKRTVRPAPAPPGARLSSARLPHIADHYEMRVASRGGGYQYCLCPQR